MCRYHSIVVPAFGDVHERYVELLDAALRNCINIRTFLWWASEEVSTPTLRSLISLRKLRILGLRLRRMKPEMFTETLGSLLGLDEIIFRDVPELLTPGVISWVGRMSTLQSLTIEVPPNVSCDIMECSIPSQNAMFLDDSTLQALQLPNLRRLMLSNCPEITSETIYHFLLLSTGIEQLYLHLKALVS